VAKVCKFCEGLIPSIRGKSAVFCSSVCRGKWYSSGSNELSRQPRAVARRHKEAVKRAEQQTDESLKRYLDEQTTLSRIRFEERTRGPLASKDQRRQVMLVRPDLEKE
jgi:hypothetical protein